VKLLLLIVALVGVPGGVVVYVNFFMSACTTAFVWTRSDQTGNCYYHNTGCIPDGYQREAVTACDCDRLDPGPYPRSDRFTDWQAEQCRGSQEARLRRRDNRRAAREEQRPALTVTPPDRESPQRREADRAAARAAYRSTWAAAGPRLSRKHAAKDATPTSS